MRLCCASSRRFCALVTRDRGGRAVPAWCRRMMSSLSRPVLSSYKSYARSPLAPPWSGVPCAPCPDPRPEAGGHHQGIPLTRIAEETCQRAFSPCPCETLTDTFGDDTPHFVFQPVYACGISDARTSYAAQCLGHLRPRGTNPIRSMSPRTQDDSGPRGGRTWA